MKVTEFLFSFQVNREMNNLIEMLQKKSEEEAAAAAQNEEAEGVDDGAEDDEAEGVDEMADVDEADEVGDVGDDDEAKAKVEGLDESEPSGGAIENGKTVISDKVEGKKVLNSPNGKIDAGVNSNGKAANTEEAHGEKFDAPGKRKAVGGAGGGRRGKRAKKDD